MPPENSASNSEDIVDEYTPAPPHPREQERLRALRELNVLDTPGDPRFDRLTRFAADLFDVPMALISLVDEERQWFLSRVGLDVCETPRDAAFCAHTLHRRETLIVEDARADLRFARNPLVTGEPHVRFYAGALIQAEDGLPLGTLCLIDQMPRRFSGDDERRLLVLARMLSDEIVPATRGGAGRTRTDLAAQVDPITKVRWQSAFGETVDRFLADTDPATTRFVVINLRNLPYLNSVFGRVVGDEILVEVTNRLERACRPNATIRMGRLSGRRLAAFLLREAPTAPDDDLEARLVEALSRPIETSTGALSPDISIGIAGGDDGVRSYQDGLERCYIALSNVVERRGVVSAVFCPAGRETLDRELGIAAELKSAITGDRLHLVYQPKVDAFNEGVVGFECLLRWTHESLGAISPPEIMKAAERMNLTPAVDHWVIDRALRQMADWRSLGLEYGRVSVNVTGATLTAPGFVDWLTEALDAYRTPERQLDLEIVETSIFEDFETVCDAMRRIDRLSVSFSLDDFGTGYSSLAYLRLLPVKTLKIDRSFVASMLDNPSDATLCSGIIAMARDMGLTTVAEGVESAAQCELLRSYLCDQLQGFFFAKPMAVSDSTEYLRRRGG